MKRRRRAFPRGSGASRPAARSAAPWVTGVRAGQFTNPGERGRAAGIDALAMVERLSMTTRLSWWRDDEETGDCADGLAPVCGDGEHQQRMHRSPRDVAQRYAHGGPTMAVGAEGHACAVEGHDMVDDGATGSGSDGHGLEDGIKPSALAARERTEHDGIGAAAGKGIAAHVGLWHKSGSYGQRG